MNSLAGTEINIGITLAVFCWFAPISSDAAADASFFSSYFSSTVVANRIELLVAHTLLTHDDVDVF